MLVFNLGNIDSDHVADFPASDMHFLVWDAGHIEHIGSTPETTCSSRLGYCWETMACLCSHSSNELVFGVSQTQIQA